MSVLCNNLYKVKAFLTGCRKKKARRPVRPFSYHLIHCKQVGTSGIQHFLPPFSVRDSQISQDLQTSSHKHSLPFKNSDAPIVISHPAAYKALLMITSELSSQAASQLTNTYSIEDSDYEGRNSENVSQIELIGSQLVRGNYFMMAPLFSCKWRWSFEISS